MKWTTISRGAVTVASKIDTGNRLTYHAIDLTATASLLGGENFRTIEASCCQPTTAGGDAQTILCLSRQGGPDNHNFAFVNSLKTTARL